jgi:GTP cyclohydrolase IA
VQERLTEEVAEALAKVLQPKGVVVIAEARHMCMAMRGVQKQRSSTITCATRGAHEEILSILKGS